MFLAVFVALLLAIPYSTEGCCCGDDPRCFKLVDEFPGSTAVSPRFTRNYTNFVCEHSLVIRTRISSKSSINNTQDGVTGATTIDLYNNDHSIDVENVTIFRNTNNASVPTAIRTPGNGGSCGMVFVEGAEYLILGKSLGNQISTTMCDHNQIWSKLPREVIDGLESGQLVDQCKPEELKS